MHSPSQRVYSIIADADHLLWAANSQSGVKLLPEPVDPLTRSD
jgi:hypothetical protein